MVALHGVGLALHSGWIRLLLSYLLSLLCTYFCLSLSIRKVCLEYAAHERYDTKIGNSGWIDDTSLTPIESYDGYFTLLSCTLDMYSSRSLLNSENLVNTNKHHFVTALFLSVQILSIQGNMKSNLPFRPQSLPRALDAWWDLRCCMDAWNVSNE